MPVPAKKRTSKLPFDKYSLYSQAVQSPEEDVKYYRRVYKQLCGGKSPVSLREDFCGAGAISCEWVKLDKRHTSCGLDLDQEPMDYGRQNYISKLSDDQKQRIKLVQKNVLSPDLPPADVVVAVNFSYFFFKKRETLKHYFENVYKSLNPNGLFVLDIFGGTQCTDSIEDSTRHKGFTYYWDQKNFDPVTNEAYFEIHFKCNGKKYQNVFSYDWRMWSIPEIREIMEEVGFKSSTVYWEGTDKNGRGNGIFKEVKKGESCLSWIAYIAGVK
jgi:SAM-dependent methyltransferase